MGVGYRVAMIASTVCNPVLGYFPTQHQVSWNGCALFTCNGELIADVWVLGDLKDLKEHLNADET